MTIFKNSTFNFVLCCSVVLIISISSSVSYSDIQIAYSHQRISVPCSSLNEETGQAGTIFLSRGHARLNDNHSSNVKPGTRIKAGDEIITGKDGFVGIIMNNKKISTIQPDTQARLICGELETGKPYVIMRSYISAAVRG